jgi:carbonic anhydrase/acetyltransferase-like protein (isoleucine patch superfamily)
MAIYSLGREVPSIDASAHVADAASVIGRVALGPGVQVLEQAVLRADNEPIAVAAGSVVGAGAVLHTDPGYPLHIGAGVAIGSQAMLHGCTVGENTQIGERAVVLNGAVIGRNCRIANHALVTEGKVFGDDLLIRGAPAKLGEPLR